jgi:hypothetical protein
MDERIRRQVYELSLQDLADYPVWEFCSDEESVEGQDEATVKPANVTHATDEAGAYVFAVDVVYADGERAIGYRYSGSVKEFGTIQPCVVTASGQVSFWYGMLRFVDIEAVKTDAYARLRKTSTDLFPIEFLTRVPVEGQNQKVRVSGFMGLDDIQRVSVFR